jgi:hypothetical protein
MDIEKDIGGRRESTFSDHRRGSQFDALNEGIVTEDVNKLKRNLHGRHMQMIAIGMFPSMGATHCILTIFQVVPSVQVSSLVPVARCVAVARGLW